jgi:HAD superfamily hydrolase (TIGR01549 family)
MSRTKTLWVREPYLYQILSGRKTVEVRVGYDNIRHLEPGDVLKLNDEHTVTIWRVGHYKDFEDLLLHEDSAAIAPDLEGDSAALLDALRQIYPPEKEALGAIALELDTAQRANPETRRYDAVLFDMGYTLIYFEPIQEVIVQEALRAIGVERSVQEVNAAVQVVWGAYYAEAATTSFPATEKYSHQVELELSKGLLEELGVNTEEAALRTYRQALESGFNRPGALRPYSEVVEVLTALQEQGYRLGIVSNWSWNLRDRVVQAGLDPFFELVWASACAGCNKPHPRIFEQALAQMELSPERALYIGDSYSHDVAGARNAGVDVLLLDRPGTAGDVDCPVIRDLWGIWGAL